MAQHRPQTRAEELANSLSHGSGLLLAAAALPVLIVTADRTSPLTLLGRAIFGVTMILCYLTSTVYHALHDGRAKRVFRVLDHSAIYLLIAGTYTPFLLGAMRGAWGWSLLGVVWTLALAGIIAKLTIGFRFPRLSTAFYVAMGWLAIVAVQPMLANVSGSGILWLLAGGLCYTGGVVFYVTDARLRFGHAVWHLFVLGGTACHFVAVLYHSATRLA